MKTNDIIDPALVQHNRIVELEQENTKLRQQVEYLNAKLYPPEPPKRALKYWIVTWVEPTNFPWSRACESWKDVLTIKATCEERNYTHIRILEQIVYV